MTLIKNNEEKAAYNNTVWQNAGLTIRNINFCFAIVLQLSGRWNSYQ